MGLSSICNSSKSRSRVLAIDGEELDCLAKMDLGCLKQLGDWSGIFESVHFFSACGYINHPVEDPRLWLQYIDYRVGSPSHDG